MEKQPQPKTSVKSSVLPLASAMTLNATNTETMPVALDARKMSSVSVVSSTAMLPINTISSTYTNQPSYYATQSGQFFPKFGEFASDKHGTHLPVPRNDTSADRTGSLSASPIPAPNNPATHSYPYYPYSQSSYHYRHQSNDQTNILSLQNPKSNTISTMQSPNEIFVSGQQAESSYGNPSQEGSEKQSGLEDHSNTNTFHGLSPITNYQSGAGNILPSIDRLTNKSSSQSGFSDVGHYPKTSSFSKPLSVGAFGAGHNLSAGNEINILTKVYSIQRILRHHSNLRILAKMCLNMNHNLL